MISIRVFLILLLFLSALAEARECFLDQMTPEKIRLDLNRLNKNHFESSVENVALGGRLIQGLEGSAAKAIQSRNFLMPYLSDSWVGSSVKQKDCRTLECLIQALYTTNENEGLYSSWFYSKTGYLAASQKGYPWYSAESGGMVKNLKPTIYPREKYLWSAAEWKAWWLTANLLPKSMSHLPTLQTIHRLPEGFTPKEWKKTRECAWAFGSQSQGVVILSDGCLELDELDPMNTRKSYFYSATTHEIAHRLSAAKVGTAMHEDPEFLALSGWKKEELVTQDGSMQLFWKASTPESEFLSAHARSHPAEDFAESVGYFRTDPERAKKASEKKYQYIKEKVFEGQGYTAPERVEAYVTRISAGIVGSVSDWIQVCRDPSQIHAASNFGEALAIRIDLPVSDEMKRCMRSQINQRIALGFEALKKNEFEGCSVVESHESQMGAKLLDRISTDLNAYLVNTDLILNDLQGVSAFREKLDRGFDAEAALIECALEGKSQACFETQRSQEFDQAIRIYGYLLPNLNSPLVTLEKRRFENQFLFSSVEQSLKEKAQKDFKEVLEGIDDDTGALWNSCLAIRPYTLRGDPRFTPYDAGVRYVAPYFIECLNEKIQEWLDARAIDGGATNPRRRREWVSRTILYPPMKAQIDSKIDQAIEDERKRLSPMLPALQDRVVEALIQNQSWRRSAYSHRDCRTGAEKVIRVEVDGDSYRFLDLRNELYGLMNKVCAQVREWVVAHPEVRPSGIRAVTLVPTPTPVEEPKKIPESVLDPVWESYEPYFVKAASERFEHCRSRLYFTSRLRGHCLFGEWVYDDVDQFKKNAWSWTTDQATRDWIKDSRVSQWMVQNSYSQTQVLEVIRKRVDHESQKFVDAVYARFYE